LDAENKGDEIKAEVGWRPAGASARGRARPPLRWNRPRPRHWPDARDHLRQRGHRRHRLGRGVWNSR